MSYFKAKMHTPLGKLNLQRFAIVYKGAATVKEGGGGKGMEGNRGRRGEGKGWQG